MLDRLPHHATTVVTTTSPPACDTPEPANQVRPQPAEQPAEGEDFCSASADLGLALDNLFREFQYPTPPEHADLGIKERALAMTTPAPIKPGRYKPPDAVLAFLESL